jgi:hypothetical protein
LVREMRPLASHVQLLMIKEISMLEVPILLYMYGQNVVANKVSKVITVDSLAH